MLMYIQHILDTDGGTSRCWAGSFAAKPCNVITVIVEIMPIEISRCLFLAISLSLSLYMCLFICVCHTSMVEASAQKVLGHPF